MALDLMPPKADDPRLDRIRQLLVDDPALVERVDERENMWHCGIFEAERWMVTQPDGQEGERDIVLHNGGAGVCVVRDGRMLAQTTQISALTHSRMLLPMAEDLLKNGAKGIITYDGNVHYKDRDIDLKELRPHVVGEEGKKILAVNINAKDAFALVKGGARSAKIKVHQKEGKGKSHNVVAEIPGTTDEWIVLSAHLDTTPLSRGSYDNMTGCIGLLMVMDALKNKPHRYGLRFVFCGSEERGLLGSKAYVAAHEKELEKMALNINLDMIGTYMGHFLARVSADEGLVTFIKYFAAAQGFGINASQGVYSSDSTPFADKGVPALSFARIAGPSQATIHNRYDTPELLSDEQMLKDGAFITEFTRFMADAVKCPVKREIPEKVKKQLDEYLARKRKEE